MSMIANYTLHGEHGDWRPDGLDDLLLSYFQIKLSSEANLNSAAAKYLGGGGHNFL